MWKFMVASLLTAKPKGVIHQPEVEAFVAELHLLLAFIDSHSFWHDRLHYLVYYVMAPLEAGFVKIG